MTAAMYTPYGMIRGRPGGCSFAALHIFQLVSGYTVHLLFDQAFPTLVSLLLGASCRSRLEFRRGTEKRECRGECRMTHSSRIIQAQVDLRGPHDVVLDLLVFAATKSCMFPLSLVSYISRGRFSRVHSCVSPPHLSNPICLHPLRASLRPHARSRNLTKLNR